MAQVVPAIVGVGGKASGTSVPLLLNLLHGYQPDPSSGKKENSIGVNDT